MKWLHCNKCGVRRSSNISIKFFCGSCSHVLCKGCNIENNTCPIDNRPFKGIEISNSMPYKLRIYFEDINKQVASLKKCIRFQCKQRSLYEELQLLDADKQNRMQLEKEIGLLTKAKNIMIKSIEKEMKRNKKMKGCLKQCRRQHPEEFNESLSNSISSASTASLNVSNALEESGVDLEFDELNSRA